MIINQVKVIQKLSADYKQTVQMKRTVTLQTKRVVIMDALLKGLSSEN